MPPAGAYLWSWFLELHRARGGGFGPAPIGFTEIAAWSRLRGLVLTPWEVEVLRDLDSTWLAAQAEKKG